MNYHFIILLPCLYLCVNEIFKAHKVYTRKFRTRCSILSRTRVPFSRSLSSSIIPLRRVEPKFQAPPVSTGSLTSTYSRAHLTSRLFTRNNDYSSTVLVPRYISFYLVRLVDPHKIVCRLNDAMVLPESFRQIEIIPEKRVMNKSIRKPANDKDYRSYCLRDTDAPNGCAYPDERQKNEKI